MMGKYGGEIVVKQGLGTRNPTNKFNTKFKILGEAKGETMDLGGGQVQDWMVVSIQASVSGSICQFLQIYTCLIVLSSITKKGEIQETWPH
jgi:hypothetical protein